MRSCVFCGANIPRPISIGFIFSFQAAEESYICQKCLNQFEQFGAMNVCPGCNRKQEEKKMCMDCVKWADRYKSFSPQHKALYAYNEMARLFMNQFKFQGDVVLGKIFKDALTSNLKAYRKTHKIVPIPLSERAKETRGFNQVEVLLKQANIPFENRLIHRGQEKKQSSKTKEERLQTNQPFRLTTLNSETIEKPFLIIDDVYTTGRTLYHARELLETLGKTETFSLFR